MGLPKAILLDLDDTILDDSSTIDACWHEACVANNSELGARDLSIVLDTIRNTSRWYWSDPERHRLGRLELNAARREVVRLALLELGIQSTSLAAKIGDDYSHHRDVGLEPLPDAIETVRWLKKSGCALALLTNGAGPAQRKKITRFDLADLFDTILVEGEVGFGKPDPRVYHLALSRLNLAPRDAWMAGDNLEWDVAAPQRLGLFSIWIDRPGRGLPTASSIRPNRIVRALSDLRILATEERLTDPTLVV
jgi:putative hydrolase of the HAD superfamily